MIIYKVTLEIIKLLPDSLENIRVGILKWTTLCAIKFCKYALENFFSGFHLEDTLL